MTKSFSPLIIMKFGGSCLKDPQDFNRIVFHLKAYPDHQKIIVISAFNSITDQLIEITHFASENQITQVYRKLKNIENFHNSFVEELFSNHLKALHEAKVQIQSLFSQLYSVLEEVEEFGIIPYFIDYVVSFGEKLSCSLLDVFLQMNGFHSHKTYGEEFLITNNQYNNALPDFHHTTHRIRQKFLPILKTPQDIKKKPVICVTGFIGRNKIGYTTTLGRGGSDFTATTIARCLADLKLFSEIKIILWKDVDGIYLGDPKHLIDPPLLEQLSYGEAKEIAALGAKILHPKCITILESTQIPLEICNFHKSQNIAHTVISNHSSGSPIKGIGILHHQIYLSIETPSLIEEPQLFATIYRTLIKNHINCNIFNKSTFQNYFSFIIAQKEIEQTIELIENHPQLPQDWFNLSYQPVGVITLITEKNSRLSVLKKMSIFLDQHQLSPLYLSYGVYGASFSMIFKEEAVVELETLLHNVLPKWNVEIGVGRKQIAPSKIESQDPGGKILE